MSLTRNITSTDVICQLKAATTALECYHNTQILKEQKKKTGCETPCTRSPTIHINIHPARDIARPKKEKSRSKAKCDTVRAPLIKTRDRDEEKIDRCRTSRLKFPEMRGGVLYSKCWCLHRNGLQDDCPLSQCRGQPECLVKPWAICPPGIYVRQRYPELYPTASNTNCIKC